MVPKSIIVTKFPPMTAAERQRRCRANGKGRHRGERGTRADSRAALAKLLAEAAAAEAAARGPSAPDRVVAAVQSPALAVDAAHLNLSAMAA